MTFCYSQSESASNIGRLDEPNPNSEAVQMRQEAAQLHARITYGVEVATPLVTGGNPYRSGTSNLEHLYMFSSNGSFEPTSSQYESSDYWVSFYKNLTMKFMWVFLLRMMMKVTMRTNGINMGSFIQW